MVPKKRILVVDDDEEFLLLVEDGLGVDPNYQVVTAQDGQSALLAAQSEAPDLIILDLRMPGLTGFEVCVALKQDPRTSSIKILIVSGYGGESDGNLAKELGANGYLKKPFPLTQLHQEVKRLLSG